MQPHILLTSIMLATTAVVALPATETTAVAQPDLGEIEVYLPPVKQYSGERGLVERQFGFGNVLSWVWNGLSVTFPMQIGVTSLIPTASEVALNCFAGFANCLNAAWSSIFQVFTAFFRAAGGRRSIGSGPTSYAVASGIVGEEKGLLTIDAHLPVEHSSSGALWRAARASGNETWSHIATVSYNGTDLHHIMHRLASADDLGHENNGSFHHLRAQSPQSMSKKRDEDNVGGVVADYIFKDGNQGDWELAIDTDAPRDAGAEATTVEMGNEMGQHLGNWMLDNGVEATCASILTQNEFDLEDQAVAAYGWNNAPFNFNGRSGGWINGCR